MPSGSSRAETAAGERGYSLVVLAMLITVLLVSVAAVLPAWSAQIRRDREQEAISRGLQYAEAIRVFQRRFGRLPNRLEELIEIEPRSIRRLWKDPLAADGGWAVIVQTPQGGVLAVDPKTGLPIDPVDPGGGPAGEPGGGPSGSGGAPATGGTPQPVVGPIRGVKSRASGAAFQSFFGEESYERWEFTVDLLLRATSTPAPTGLPRWNAMNLGRPFRFPPPGAVGPTGGLPPPPTGPAPGVGPGPRPRPAPGQPPPPGTKPGGPG